jgi:hypothetical protein
MHGRIAIRWHLGACCDDAEPEQHAGKLTGHLFGSHDNPTARSMTADLF